jgi:hypothetical protein
MDMLGFEYLVYLGMAKNNTGRICAIEAWDDVQGCVGHGGKHRLIISTLSKQR